LAGNTFHQQIMTTQQRIEAAKQRIAELERLINAWKAKS